MLRNELLRTPFALPLLLASGLCAACAPNVRPCAKDTVFVTVELQGDVATADQLVVAISVDGVGMQPKPLPHEPGKRSGGVLVEFPNGYPKGKTLRVDVTAQLGGVPIATNSVDFPVTEACHAKTITLATTASGPDLAGADLAGADLAPFVADLTGVTQDLTAPTPDLLVVDLTPPPGSDLTCMPAGAEDCFNNADDDCDGLVDCADPDCTGGATPIADCIDDFGTPLGTTAASCPTTFSVPLTLNFNFAPATCSQGTAACPSGIDPGRCHAWRNTHSASTCEAFTGQFSIDSTQGCVNLPKATSGHFIWNLPVFNFTAGFCNGTGAAAKTPASFTDTTKFCSTTLKGAGCGVGKACVPHLQKTITSGGHCTVLAGSQVACPGSYVKNTTQFFTGLSDTKSCDFSCTISSGGVCGNGARLEDSCSGGASQNTVAACLPDSDVTNGYNVITVQPPTGGGKCDTVLVTSTGTSAPTGAQTVCCAP